MTRTARRKPNHAPPVNNSDSTQGEWEYRLKWGNAIVGALTLLAVLGYGWVTYKQWGEAIRSNNLTERNIALSNRAWLIAKAVSLPPLDVPNVQFSLALTVENTGKSPAYNVTGANASVVVTDPDPFTGDPRVTEPIQVTRGVIGNGHSQKIQLRFNHLTEEQLRKIKHEKAKYVVLGNIRYDDPLGTDRETEFCFFYTFITPEYAQPEFQFCPVHNSVR